MTDLNAYMLNRISNYAPGRTDGGAETLQTIRRRDYNALDPHAVLVIVDQAITYLRSRREALAREATRLEQLQTVKNEIREIDHRLAAITGHLARALQAATNGFDPYW